MEILHSEAVHPPSVSKVYFPAIDFNDSFYSKNFEVKFPNSSLNSVCLYMIHNPFIIRIYTIILQHTVYIQIMQGLYSTTDFENKELRRIFGPRRDEVTGDWRRLHNEELNDLYCSPNIVRVIK